MLRRLSLATLACGAFAAAALPPIRGERLFRLELNGRVSYVLASAHELFPKSLRLPPVAAALRDSCQVLLQGDLNQPAAAVDGYDTPRRDVARFLNPRQLDAYQKVVGTTLATRWLHPEHAALLVREGLGEALMRAQARFGERLNEMVGYEQHALLARAAYSPHLRDVVRALYHGNLPPYYLFQRAPDADAAHAGEEQVTMPELIEARASALGLNVRRLKAPKHATLSEVQLALFDETNLRLMLDELAPLLDDVGAPSRHANMGLANLLSRELARRFFSLEPAEYVRLDALMSRALVTYRPSFRGDERLAEHEANLHAHWMRTLGTAVARGGAFIVLDLGRVIPGADPRVRLTLLEALAREGVTVKPLAAERATLRLVE